MRIDWTPLKAELALWRRADLELPVWWRDDDAVAATPALERLTALAKDVNIPVHLAVIPHFAEASLSAVIASETTLIPVVHGWQHVSHAPKGQKNAEFGQLRKEAEAELRQAIAQLNEEFGSRLLSLFVPPWNRIEPRLLPVLAELGYAGVSTYGPREVSFDAPAIVQVNTHIDPIYWRGHRGLVPPEKLLADIVGTLRDRREGRTDVAEPLGLLTHHLVHTDDVWDFSKDVMRVLLDGGATPADLRALLYAGRSPNN
ncbi:polysaccharide deacetylase family protein [Sulfitobacter sp. S223]|uniref:polysaccharide deacetylase family protein n=1 Tax=Sulfitobacter sp. S223 TaxID=2867023 RepID=UPI0021A8F280|nr:polysaccharide deacetylase family protein [Sulfitobacter sp. S223]UWR26016.1 polysaccharide deacetylase family protein [Sulfitobacter sp. S223]